jgi:hypothetical protein
MDTIQCDTLWDNDEDGIWDKMDYDRDGILDGKRCNKITWNGVRYRLAYGIR